MIAILEKMKAGRADAAQKAQRERKGHEAAYFALVRELADGGKLPSAKASELSDLMATLNLTPEQTEGHVNQIHRARKLAEQAATIPQLERALADARRALEDCLADGARRLTAIKQQMADLYHNRPNECSIERITPMLHERDHVPRLTQEAADPLRAAIVRAEAELAAARNAAAAYQSIVAGSPGLFA